MHFHHHTLRHLSRYLATRHQGDRVEEVFSQNKNELVIDLGSGFLRAGCHTPLTYLAPVESFARARKNVVALFSEIQGRTVAGCRVLPWERVLILELDANSDLVFKLHAGGANVVPGKDRGVLLMLINRHEADLTYEEAPGIYRPEALVPAVEPADEAAVLLALRAVSPVYEKQFAHKVWLGMARGLPFGESYAQVMVEVEDDWFYLRKEAQRIRFLLFEPEADAPVACVKGIAPALNLYLRSHFQYTHYLREYRQVQNEVQKPLEK